MTTYDMLASFAQRWGLLYFVGIFIAILIYAYAPSRKKRFEEASRIPLRDD